VVELCLGISSADIIGMGFIMTFNHKSVLLNEVIESLNIKADGYYVDGTLGGGGHALEVVKRLESGKLIGIDRDSDAIKAATQRLNDYINNVIIIRDNYVNIENILKRENIGKVDGIYIDLGVSSYQLDTAERGFTYRFDAPLDMRMDDRNELKASDIVNDYSESELFHIIRDYGEDRFAKNIAKHIVEYRNKKRIETTFELVDIIKASIPMKIQVTGGHPAKRTFQAIRIELNKELEVLTDSLDVMIDLLKPGGRLSVITFHSLEDRIVKQAFKKAESPCVCPKKFPVCVCGNKSKGRVITRKAILPSEEELEENSRSKSAKLRVFEKGV
jgi:S-adenosyl-methyltransferase MraW